MRILFTKTAQKQYRNWQTSNPKFVDKIDELISDIIENGFLDGIGKPEQLKYLKNPPKFSRHISQADRLVYSLTNDNELLILSCKGHYKDK